MQTRVAREEDVLGRNVLSQSVQQRGDVVQTLQGSVGTKFSGK